MRSEPGWVRGITLAAAGVLGLAGIFFIWSGWALAGKREPGVILLCCTTGACVLALAVALQQRMFRAHPGRWKLVLAVPFMFLTSFMLFTYLGKLLWPPAAAVPHVGFMRLSLFFGAICVWLLRSWHVQRKAHDEAAQGGDATDALDNETAPLGR